jgi:hypothetical protein
MGHWGACQRLFSSRAETVPSSGTSNGSWGMTDGSGPSGRISPCRDRQAAIIQAEYRERRGLPGGPQGFSFADRISAMPPRSHGSLGSADFLIEADPQAALHPGRSPSYKFGIRSAQPSDRRVAVEFEDPKSADGTVQNARWGSHEDRGRRPAERRQASSGGMPRDSKNPVVIHR